jgi:hypothetical protein
MKLRLGRKTVPHDSPRLAESWTREGIVNRERALKAVLVSVGLLFSAGIFPMVIMVRSVLQPHNESALPIVLKTADEAMMLSLYATLGIFLLLAARDPSVHRSVIAFWRMVEFCARRRHGCHVHPDANRTRRVADHFCCA